MLSSTEARSGGLFDGTLAENSVTIAGTDSTVDSKGNGGLDIPADYETMSNHKEFWKTVSIVGPSTHTAKHNPRLNELYKSFLDSQKGGRYKGSSEAHSTFRLVFKAKVDVVFTERFPKGLRSNPDVVQWEGGQADEENFTRWLNDNPGYVHIWVDETDIHAKLHPAQA